ncbi:MAG: c-type cytochrome [Mariniblastus sp.]|nr:c-type cytochrome [Mariniblastus sp.]
MIRRLFLFQSVVCLLVFCCGLFVGDSNVTAQQLSDKLKQTPLAELATAAEKFGNPQRGAIAFYQPTMNCARCHESTAQGRRLGPDLAEKRNVELAHLVQSVLDPSAIIKEGFETAQVLLEDGRQVSGVLVADNDSELIIDQIEQADLPLTIPKSEIDDWKKTKLSSMPEGLVNQMANRQQFLDLVSYLDAIAKGGSIVSQQLKPANLATMAPLPDYEARVDHAGLIRGLDKDGMLRGEETYRLRCASCHGTIEEEGSMPTSLRFATGKFKNGNDPYRMYQTLTHGYGMMIPQRWMVPQQKYEVIHYIREHFLKPENDTELFRITDAYLASLPPGDTRGPKPVVSRPWTAMNYGPSLNNTIEVSKDGSNIAQKGIAVRLDEGPGGVESGKYWMMYDHDTMRVAGAWSEGFIDYEGIHFNGTHGRHPRVAGNIQFFNPTGPGWGRPSDESFIDNRFVGRDKKRYGPLDRDWAQYKGMYRFGNQTILDYRVGETKVLEMPLLKFANGEPVFQRSINLGQRKTDLVLQVAKISEGSLTQLDGNSVAVLTGSETAARAPSTEGLEFDGSAFGEIKRGEDFDMMGADYTIAARIKTKKDGTIFAQTKSQDQWVSQGKTFFIRGGRLALDIGWVGSVRSKQKVNDGKWHDVVMTWREKDARVSFFVDGKPAGGGELRPEQKLKDQVVRIGFTNDNFPSDSFFEGSMTDVMFYQRILSEEEINRSKEYTAEKLVGSWKQQVGTSIPEVSGKKYEAVVSGSNRRREAAAGLMASVNNKQCSWEYVGDNLRLRIPAGNPLKVVISHVSVEKKKRAVELQAPIAELAKSQDLNLLVQGGPPSWPQLLTTKIQRGAEDGPFAVDVFTRPTNNPWNAQLRLTGLDFLPDGDTMVASAWDGSVWKVSGFAGDSNELVWQRIAAGLFQPLGIKWINGKVYVTCRDQLAVLHDLNDDGEMDWYECLNNDHQVTEHFHEFAMGLQTDDAGNFYYAKSARHAKTALVAHHGTLLKVSPDGEKTEILATGFRAANGVCINPDGSFVVTDQEGHWNPKNRINWVRPGQFYGNMFGYHDVTDDSDEAMSNPLCWITNAFDRSPSELLWVNSEKWGPLNGTLLNFSYGYGKVYVVPHEEIDGQMQGGMCEFPISQFPTGVMRGRFHPADGQLYCCGMFAWAGSQQQPGGLYRIRYTGKPVHLPVGLNASIEKIKIKLSGEVDPESASDISNFAISTWDLKRTANYGSKHYNQKQLEVVDAELLSDNQTIQLVIPDLKPTWGMEINYSVKTKSGEKLQGKIHNSIYNLK